MSRWSCNISCISKLWHYTHTHSHHLKTERQFLEVPSALCVCACVVCMLHSLLCTYLYRWNWSLVVATLGVLIIKFNKVARILPNVSASRKWCMCIYENCMPSPWIRYGWILFSFQYFGFVAVYTPCAPVFNWTQIQKIFIRFYWTNKYVCVCALERELNLIKRIEQQ